MSISDEAVEAAARAYFENCEYAEWVRIDEQAKAAIRTDLRAALEAALPLIAAQALSEAADKFHARLPDGTGNGRAYNSHQVAVMLREQAEGHRTSK